MRRLISIYGLSDRPVGDTTLRRLIAATAVFIALTALFAYLARGVVSGDVTAEDVRILLAINQQSNGVLNITALAVTYSANMASIIIVTAALFVFLLRRLHKRRTAIQLLFTMGGAIILNGVLKLVFRRDRPELWELLTHESTYSFPSGHSLLSATFAVFLVMIFWKTRYRKLALLLGVAYPVSVGLSRMYLGVHYPSDVLAGWCVGAAWAIVVGLIMGVVKISQDSSVKHA